MKNLMLLIGILSLVGIVIIKDDPQVGLTHERISTISAGESVDIENHLGEGFTIIEFGADW
ncbi:MAG: hypothetical protein ACI8TQ_003161 [Planctomycetota bacterium]|jgi:hypothetical protein